MQCCCRVDTARGCKEDRSYVATLADTMLGLSPFSHLSIGG